VLPSLTARSDNDVIQALAGPLILPLPMLAFYADHFVLPLPPGHRFPMRKYSMLRDAVVREVAGWNCARRRVPTMKRSHWPTPLPISRRSPPANSMRRVSARSASLVA
jgi:hypothetical protein